MIANARMYAPTPSLQQAWKSLLDEVARRAEVTWRHVEHEEPAPIRALWEREDCACVFMCGYPFATMTPRRQLLAAPVPQPDRYGGKPVYFSEFLVRADSVARTLSDTIGGRLACMLPESNSGYNAPRHYLMHLASPGVRTLYRPADVPTPTPRLALEALLQGKADVAVVDSYVVDLLRHERAPWVEQARAVATTPALPIPPLVASAAIGGEVAGRIRAALLGLHEDAGGRALLDAVVLSRFAPMHDADYDCLPWLEQAADAAGFALTGPRGPFA